MGTAEKRGGAESTDEGCDKEDEEEQGEKRGMTPSSQDLHLLQFVLPPKHSSCPDHHRLRFVSLPLLQQPFPPHKCYQQPVVSIHMSYTIRSTSSSDLPPVFITVNTPAHTLLIISDPLASDSIPACPRTNASICIALVVFFWYRVRRRCLRGLTVSTNDEEDSIPLTQSGPAHDGNGGIDETNRFWGRMRKRKERAEETLAIFDVGDSDKDELKSAR
ncbi:hypothetical protein EW146_g6292 [Bondarzewia mesenterica]|uniref:Uncharacterized protein n=1 Tax=Bondarzewia mesenterica TaxID=1095465 RepID=A0A4S4LR32_9AGAM|nr:hypothetical protein EW146_g6292 [Bondarzewia mesenterica]